MISGIIAELDPLHNGHKKLIDAAKKESDAVVICLSGNMTERGLPSYLSKNVRAAAALDAGADLVIELPSFFSSQSAERFAAAGVRLLSAVGIDALFFGSGCGDIKTLESAVAAEKKTVSLRKTLTESGLGYAAAREKALISAGYEDLVPVFQNGNDILACEYIKAVKKYAPDITVRPFLRTAGRATVSETEASSSYIRNNADVARFMPPFSYSRLLAAREGNAVSDVERAAVTIIHFFRTTPPESLSGICEISEGLQYALCKSAATADSFVSLIGGAASKRYTESRITRAALNAFLGRPGLSPEPAPPYIKALALNKKGAEILRAASKRGETVVTKPADGKKLEGFQKEVFDYELAAGELRALTLADLPPRHAELKITPYIQK